VTLFDFNSFMQFWSNGYFLLILASLFLFFVGNLLNYRCYKLLGMDGIYYGVRFGRKIPWVTEWPYGYLRDPQYIGCILQILSASPFMPFDYTILGVFSYLVLIYIESIQPVSSKAVKK